MSTSPFINDVKLDTFQAEVIALSNELPVLVDFWADWCGPCKMQLPVLATLVDSYQGKFRVAKVDTDAEQDLARQHGIRSLPTLRLYVNGQVAEEMMGVQSEAALRQVLDRYIERDSDVARRQALDSYHQGDAVQALALLNQAREEDPDNVRITLDYARLCLGEGRIEEAEQALTSLPRDVRAGDDAAMLEATLVFARASADAPDSASLDRSLMKDPHNSTLRYQLAARQVLDQDYDSALDNLMTLLLRDRDYGDHAARKGLLSLFELLGEHDERVSHYRRKMFNALH